MVSRLEVRGLEEAPEGGAGVGIRPVRAMESALAPGQLVDHDRGQRPSPGVDLGPARGPRPDARKGVRLNRKEYRAANFGASAAPPGRTCAARRSPTPYASPITLDPPAGPAAPACPAPLPRAPRPACTGGAGKARLRRRGRRLRPRRPVARHARGGGAGPALPGHAGAVPPGTPRAAASAPFQRCSSSGR